MIVVKCSDPGYVCGSSVTFARDTNYTTKGRERIICKADKSWSGSVPQCLDKYNVV